MLPSRLCQMVDLLTSSEMLMSGANPDDAAAGMSFLALGICKIQN